MMMNSRGDTPPAVAALRMQYELLELAKSADLPAHIAQLREAEKAARAAFDALDKKTAEHDARDKGLDEIAVNLEARLKQITARETACAASERANTLQAREIDAQKAALAARKQELDDGANLLAADKAAFDKTKLQHAGDLEAKSRAINEETNRMHRDSEATIQAIRDEALGEIGAWRATAQADIAAQHEELRQREAKIAAREEELHRERARIRELL